LTELQPTPLGRSRGPDPGVIVAVVVVAFVGLALAKPWSWGTGTTARASLSASPSAAASAEDRAAAIPAPNRTPDREPRGLSWRRLRGVLTTVDAWGVRLVLHVGWGRGPVPRYEEEWLSVTPDRTGGPDPANAAKVEFTSRPGTRIVAVGLTAPRGETPLDVRLTRVPPDGPPERLALQEMPGRVDGLERLFLPPSDGQMTGHHRIDLLMGDTVARVAFRIGGSAPARGAEAEAPEESASAAERRRRRDLQDLLDVAEAGVGAAVIDGTWRRVPLEGGTRGAVTEAAAWLAASDGIAPLRYPASEVRAIGTAVASRSAEVTLRVEALIRAEGGSISVIRSPARPSSPKRRGRRPAVVAIQQGQRAWPPGTYLVTTEHQEGVRVVRRTQVLELLPDGPFDSTPVLLAAARSWARFASGKPGWLIPTAAYPVAELAHRLRRGRIRPLPDPGAATSHDRCPPRSTLDGSVPVVGIVGTGDRQWPVRVRWVGPSGPGAANVHIARPLTGLTLIAPGRLEDRREPRWVPGIYEIVLGGPGGDSKGNDSPARPPARTVRFCVLGP
jgi:hypothetical protein